MQAGCDWTCLQMLLFKLFPDELERTTELVCIGGDMESLRQWWHASERAGCWCVGAQASGVQVASFWPGLFVSAMQGQDMAKLVCSLPDGGSGGGGGGGGDAAPAAAAAGKAPEGEPDHISTVPGGPASTCIFLGCFHPRLSIVLFWRCTRLCRAHAHANGRMRAHTCSVD
jgi:hypothetical protein